MPNDEIVATRTLKCVTPQGAECEIEIGFSKPVKDAVSGDWCCRCLTAGGGLEPDKTMTVFGADSVQALLLAITTMRTKLKIYKRDGYRFEWIANVGDELP